MAPFGMQSCHSRSEIDAGGARLEGRKGSITGKILRAGDTPLYWAHTSAIDFAGCI